MNFVKYTNYSESSNTGDKYDFFLKKAEALNYFILEMEKSGSHLERKVLYFSERKEEKEITESVVKKWQRVTVDLNNLPHPSSFSKSEFSNIYQMRFLVS